MNPTVKKVLIVTGILAGMALVVLATAFVVYLFISGISDEYSRA